MVCFLGGLFVVQLLQLVLDDIYCPISPCGAWRCISSKMRFFLENFQLGPAIREGLIKTALQNRILISNVSQGKKNLSAHLASDVGIRVCRIPYRTGMSGPATLSIPSDPPHIQRRPVVAIYQSSVVARCDKGYPNPFPSSLWFCTERQMQSVVSRAM
jgi:hypothetical protein